MKETDGVVKIKLDVPASHQYLNVVGACVRAALARSESAAHMEQFAYDLELAVHETCSNIVEHAYADVPGRIQLTMTLAPLQEQIEVELRDTGQAFDLSTVAEPNLDEVQTHGYGLFLVRSLVNEVSYFPQNGDNRWRLVKRLPPASLSS